MGFFTWATDPEAGWTLAADSVNAWSDAAGLLALAALHGRSRYWRGS